MKTPLVLLILISFLVTAVIGPMPVYAQDGFYLPAPGTMVNLSAEFSPPILKGIKVHPDNPFKFDFILDKGESAPSNAHLKEESTKLIRYFLAGLTTPDKDLWVNLSPYEKDRIIPPSFGLTEMGRDLLAEDYVLKQITASLIYPEDVIGKKFWKRIYEEAQKKFGTTDIPVNTFNKVWIVPQKAVIYENVKAGTAYVVESKLKVMLEQDYLSLQKHISNTQGISLTASKQLGLLGSNIVREIIIPELTKEVNENMNFFRLRQVYNSLILAAWYKKKIKDSLLEQVYANKNKTSGVEYTSSVLPVKSGTPLKNDVEGLYKEYLRAFKKGVYNYIKEEIDPLTNEVIPRKYFSGGFEATDLARITLKIIDHFTSPPSSLTDRFTDISLLLIVPGGHPLVFRLKPAVQKRSAAINAVNDSKMVSQQEKVDIVAFTQSLFKNGPAYILSIKVPVTPQLPKTPDVSTKDKAQLSSWNSLPVFEARKYSRDLKKEDAARYRQNTLSFRNNLQIDFEGNTVTIDHHLLDRGITLEQWRNIFGEWFGKLSAEDKIKFRENVLGAKSTGGLVIGSIPRENDKWSSKEMVNYDAATGFLGINEYVLTARMNDPLLATLIFDAISHSESVTPKQVSTPAENTEERIFKAVGGKGSSKDAVKEWQRRAETARYNVSQHNADVFIEYAKEEYRLISHGDDELKAVYAELREIFDRLLVAGGYDPANFNFHLADYSDSNAFVVSFSNHVVLNIGLLWEFFYAIQGDRNHGDPQKFFSFFKDHMALVLAHEISHISQDRDKVNKGEAPRSETFDDMKKRMERSNVQQALEKVQEQADVYANEIDADRHALDLMDEAGFSVKQANRPFEMLREAMERDGNKENFFGDHPMMGERIRNILRAVRPNYFKNYHTPSKPFSPAFATELMGWHDSEYKLKRTRVRTFYARLMSVKTTTDLTDLIRDAKTPKELEMASTYGVYSLLLSQAREYQSSHQDSPSVQQFFRLNTRLRQILEKNMAKAIPKILREGLDRNGKKRNWLTTMLIVGLKKLNQGMDRINVMGRDYYLAVTTGYKKDHPLRTGQSIIDTESEMVAVNNDVQTEDDRMLMWFLEYVLNNREWKPIPVIRYRDFTGKTELGSASYLERGTDPVPDLLKPLSDELISNVEQESAPVTAGMRESFADMFQNMGLSEELAQIRTATAQRLSEIDGDARTVKSRIEEFYAKTAMRAFFGETESSPQQIQEWDYKTEQRSLVDSIARLPKNEIFDVLNDVLDSVWRSDLTAQDPEGQWRHKLMMRKQKFPADVQRQGAGVMTAELVMAIENIIKNRAGEFTMGELVNFLNKILSIKEVGRLKYGGSGEGIGRAAVEEIIKKLQERSEPMTDETLELLLNVFNNFPELLSQSAACQQFFLDVMIFNPKNYEKYREDIMLIFSKGNVISRFSDSILKGFIEGKLDANRYFSKDLWRNDPGKVFFEFYDLLQKDTRALNFIEKHLGFSTPVEKLKFSESLFNELSLRPVKEEELMLSKRYENHSLSHFFFIYSYSLLEGYTPRSDVDEHDLGKYKSTKLPDRPQPGVEIVRPVDGGWANDFGLLRLKPEFRTPDPLAEQHVNNILMNKALELNLGETFANKIPNLNSHAKSLMYLLGIGGFVSMDRFYEMVDENIKDWTTDDVEALYTFLQALTPLQANRKFAQKYFLTPVTWSEYLVPLSLYVIHKKFNFDLTLGENASFLTKEKWHADHKYPIWAGEIILSAQENVDNPYQVLLGEVPSLLFNEPPTDLISFQMWLKSLLEKVENVPVDAVLAGVNSSTRATDRMNLSRFKRDRLLKVFDFVKSNPQFDFNYWVDFSKKYMPPSAFRDLFLYYILWDKHLAAAAGVSDTKKWDKFNDLDFILSSFRKHHLEGNTQLEDAVRMITPLMVEDRFIKKINGISTSAVAAWVGQSSDQLRFEKENLTGKNLIYGSEFSFIFKRLSPWLLDKLAFIKMMFEPLLKITLTLPLYLFGKLIFKIFMIFHLEALPTAKIWLFWLTWWGLAGLSTGPRTTDYGPLDLYRGVYKRLTVEQLDKVTSMWFNATMLREIYSPLRSYEPLRLLFSLMFSLITRLSTNRLKAQFNEEGSINSQIDLVTAYPYRDMLLKQAQGSAKDWEKTAQNIQVYFIRPSPVRDELLTTLADQVLADTDIPINEKLSAMEKLTPLMYHDFFKDRFHLRSLEMAVEMAKQNNREITFEQELALVFKYFPDYSFTRDDILLELMERARHPEEDKLIRDNLLNLQENAIKEKVKNKITAENKIREAIQKASNLDKEEFALWVMGLRAEKPLIVMEMEFFTKTDLSYLKDVFNQLGSKRYPSVGNSTKKDLMESLFGGKDGLMRDKNRMAHFLNVVFEKSVPKNMADRKSLKKVFETVFRHLDEDKKLEVISALASKMKTDGTSSVAELVKTFFESMGLVGIKLAQIISHSDTNLDPLIKDALQKLSSSADPLGKRYVFQLLRLALGEDFDKYIDYIGDRIGSASIKLVYKVGLKDGREVVLKIKRPHIDKVIDAELKMLEEILDDLGRSGLDIPPGLGKQVASYLREEVDFDVERANQKRFSEFQESRKRDILIGSKKVIIRTAEGYPDLDAMLPESLRGQAIFEEELHGVELNDEARLRTELGLTENEIKEVKEKVFNELMDEMFVDGFFHADPHGGNIWVNKKEDGSLELIFLDLGSMGRNDAKVSRSALEAASSQGDDTLVNGKEFVQSENGEDQNDLILNPNLTAQDFGADQVSQQLKELWERGMDGKKTRSLQLAQWLCYMALHPGEVPEIPEGRILESTFFKKVGYLLKAMDPMQTAALIFSKLGHHFPQNRNQQMAALRLASEGKWEMVGKQDFSPKLADRVRAFASKFIMRKSSRSSSDKATLSVIKGHENGGIDFDPDKMNLQIQNAGQGIKFHLDPAMLQQFRNAPGFEPVIINMLPIKDLSGFLGVDQSAEKIK